MITEIGIVAGEIWHYLDGYGEVTFSQLVGGLERPEPLVLMSLGWLAREGHVIVQQEARQLKVSLRRESS